MSHPIVQVLGDVLQLGSTQGLLRALRLEPRRTIVSRALSSLKLLGTGVAIGQGLDRYGDTIVDYALRSTRRRPRALATAGWIAAGVLVGVGAAILLVPELRARGWNGTKTQSVAPSPVTPVTSPATASSTAPSSNGGSA
jgi:hypothetical protein